VTDFARLFAALHEGDVAFIVIGGFAATAHGSAHVTTDLDLVYQRTTENVERMVGALAPLHPYLRGAPPGLPFRFDRATVERGLNFTLRTDAGDLDLLGEASGGGTFEALLPHSAEQIVFGHATRIVTLDMLIRLKRAAGRPRDIDRIAELEAIVEERSAGHPPREA
jgi:hypothetical protein